MAREEDSGIEVCSAPNSDNASSNSTESDLNSDVIEVGTNFQDDGSLELNRDNIAPLLHPPEFVIPDHTLAKQEETIEKKLTLLMQKAMFYISMVTMAIHLWTTRGSPKKGKRRARVAVNLSFCSLAYLLVLAVSLALLLQLRLSDKPPQFFSPDSNIQKLLDLVGNISDVDAVDGYSYSEWSSKDNCEN